MELRGLGLEISLCLLFLDQHNILFNVASTDSGYIFQKLQHLELRVMSSAIFGAHREASRETERPRYCSSESVPHTLCHKVFNRWGSMFSRWEVLHRSLGHLAYQKQPERKWVTEFALTAHTTSLGIVTLYVTVVCVEKKWGVSKCFWNEYIKSKFCNFCVFILAKSWHVFSEMTKNNNLLDITKTPHYIQWELSVTLFYLFHSHILQYIFKTDFCTVN